MLFRLADADGTLNLWLLSYTEGKIRRYSLRT